jgi:UDP-N-acetylglucosamine:LPS N-acetylglucosamine transferase
MYVELKIPGASEFFEYFDDFDAAFQAADFSVCDCGGKIYS